MSDPQSPDTAGGGTHVLDRQLDELRNDELNEDRDQDPIAPNVEKEKIVESAVTGKPVRALCGKVWVPRRDPEKFPVCPDCKAIYERMK
jgi:hypothetical protein